MKNICNQKDFEETVTRINQLTPDSKRLWGKMNANQMICHVSDPVRGALGVRQYKGAGNFFFHTVLKWTFLYVMSFPKGAPTDPEFNQLEGTGTPVTDFNSDHRTLLQLLQQLHAKEKGAILIKHPLFGKMSRWEWGRMTYQHLDHHLRQFGV